MSSMTVMSFNLRTPVEGHPAGHPDLWEPRLEASIALLADRSPDLIGVQEGMWPQLRRILDELPDYRMVGTGREGGSAGEYSAVLFRADRFRLDGWQQCWLSATPDLIGSSDWDAGCPRIATRAELFDLVVQRRIILINTHLDHQSELARVKGAEVIRDRLLTPPVEDAVTVLTGDFNCAAASAPAWQLLTEVGLHDSWLVARTRGPEFCTFHGYAEPGPLPTDPWPGTLPDTRIDWILTSAEVSNASIITDRPGGVWPSDHWPVSAILEL